MMNFNKTILAVEFHVCEEEWAEVVEEEAERVRLHLGAVTSTSS
jgi:hypothetical protein